MMLFTIITQQNLVLTHKDDLVFYLYYRIKHDLQKESFII